MQRPHSAPARRKALSDSGNVHLSLKLRAAGGTQLQHWLSRKGVLLGASITKQQKEELTTVFELYDEDAQGKIAAYNIENAFKTLNLKPSKNGPPIDTKTTELIDFEEFIRRMVKHGYGNRDILDEIYGPDATQVQQKAGEAEQTTPTLTLMRARRDRMLKTILGEHLERQKEIYGEEETENILKVAQRSLGGVTPSRPHSSTHGDIKTSESSKLLDLLQGGERPEKSRAHHGNAKIKFANATRVASWGSHGSTFPKKRSSSVLFPYKMMTGFAALVLQARGLPANLKLRTDSSVVLEYGTQVRRTKHTRNNIQPHWNATLRFQATQTAKEQDLKITLYVSEPGHPDPESDMVGVATIPSEKIKHGHQAWVKLDSKRFMQHIKTEIYISIKPVWLADHLHEDVPDHDAPLEGTIKVRDIDAKEASHMEQMRKLIAWEQGERGEMMDQMEQRSQRKSKLFVPPVTKLFATCARKLPVSLAAADVLAKLRTPFAQHFKVESLDPHYLPPERHMMRDLLHSNVPLKLIKASKAGTLLKTVEEPFARIGVGSGHCLAVDRHGATFLWGDAESELLNLHRKAQAEVQAASQAQKMTEDYQHHLMQRAGVIEAEGQRFQDLDEERMADRDKSSGNFEHDKWRRPQLLKSLKNVSVFDVACGLNHCLALTKDGLVYTWGKGDFGKLGHGGLWDEAAPRVVQHISKRRTIQIGCGSNHSMAVTDNGSLWSWGDGRFGQLGHGLPRDCGLPCRVRALEDVDGVRSIACGSDHSAALLWNGEVYTWGMGWHGQLGHERVIQDTSHLALRPSGHRSSAVGNKGGHKIAAKQPHESDSLTQEIMERLDVHEGEILCDIGHERSKREDDLRARISSTPKLVDLLGNCHIDQIACGSRHTLAYQCDKESATHEVWSWGEGRGGKLGHGTTHNEYEPRQIDRLSSVPIVNMACGETWSAVFLSEDEVMVYGKLDYGAKLEYRKL